jgi:cell shape-determining protein MreC
LYKKNILSIIDSLRELNSKLLGEISELRRENAYNAKLKQIIEESARRESENTELKSRVGSDTRGVTRGVTSPIKEVNPLVLLWRRILNSGWSDYTRW